MTKDCINVSAEMGAISIADTNDSVLVGYINDEFFHIVPRANPPFILRSYKSFDGTQRNLLQFRAILPIRKRSVYVTNNNIFAESKRIGY